MENEQKTVPVYDIAELTEWAILRRQAEQSWDSLLCNELKGTNSPAEPQFVIPHAVNDNTQRVRNHNALMERMVREARRIYNDAHGTNVCTLRQASLATRTLARLLPSLK